MTGVWCGTTWWVHSASGHLWRQSDRLHFAW